MAFPAGSGQSEPVSYYAAIFDQQYPGAGVGAAFEAYAAQHPGTAPLTLANAFLLIITTKGLAAALQQATGAVGNATGQAATGVGSGLASLGSTFSILPNIATWVVRVAEIALGLVLIAVGVAKLTSIDIPYASKIAKAVS